MTSRNEQPRPSSSHTRRGRLHVWFAIVWVTVLIPFVDSVVAQESPERSDSSLSVEEGPSVISVPPARQLREATIPLERLKTLVANGEWVPIGRSELDRLAAALSDDAVVSANPIFERVVYSTRFESGILTDGNLTANLQQARDRVGGLNLGALNLQNLILNWEDDEALFGTASNGESFLIVDKGHRRLTGTWSLRGHSRPDRSEFDVRLIPAVASVLDITTPKNFRVESSAGVVSSVLPGTVPGTSVWKIEAGSATQLRIRIMAEPEETLQSGGGVMTQHVQAWSIGEDRIVVNSDLTFETIQYPADGFVLSVPIGMQLDSVTYGSEELDASHVNIVGTTQEVTFALPEPLRGSSRRVHVIASGRTQSDYDWTIAPLEITRCYSRSSVRTSVDCILESGDLRLRIAQPLEVHALDSYNLRVVDTTFSPDGSQTIRFAQSFRQAECRIRLGYPTLAVRAAVASRISVGSQVWLVDSMFRLRTEAGRAWSARFDVAKEWEVTSVRSGTPPGLVNARINNGPDDRRIVEVDFADAVSAGAERTIHISARRVPATGDHELAIPIIEPVNVPTQVSVVEVGHTGIPQPVVSPDTDWREVQVNELNAEQRDLFEGLAQDVPPKDRLLLATSVSNGVGAIVWKSRPPGFEAQVDVDVSIDGDTLTEQHTITVNSGTSQLDSLLVYVHSGSLPHWTTNGSRLPVHAIAADDDRWRNLPSTGSLWSVDLPDAATTGMQITARRNVAFAADTAVSLVSLPDATVFDGRVRVTATRPILAAVSDESSGRPVPVPVSIEPNREWQHAFDSAAIQLVLRDPNAARRTTVQPMARIRIQTVFPESDADSALHVVRIQPGYPSGSNVFSVTFTGNCHSLACFVNGQPVATRQGDSKTVEIAIDPETRDNEITLRYSTKPLRTRFGAIRAQHHIPIPKCSQPSGSLVWDCWTAPDWQPVVNDQDSNSLITQNIRSLARLLGPMVRSPWDDRSTPVRSSMLVPVWTTPGTRQDGTANDRSDGRSRFETWTHRHCDPDVTATMLHVSLFNLRQLNVLAWSLLAASFVIVVLARMWSASRRVPLFLLILLSVSVWWLPAEPAYLVGAALGGVFTSIAVPHRFLRRDIDRNDETTGVAIPVGSTVRLPDLSASGVVALLMLVNTSAGQEPTTTMKTQMTPGNQRAPDAGLPNDYDVVVPPIPSAELPIVYVRKSMLQRMESALQRRVETLGYLITDAEYHVTLESAATAKVSAKLTLAYVPGDSPMKAYVPFDSMNPGECRIDDRVCSLLQSDRGNGLMVLLDQSRASDRPAGVRILTVDLYPPMTRTATGGRLHLEVPPVAVSRFRLDVAQQTSAVTLERDGEPATAIGQGTTVEFQPGPVSSFDIVWSFTPPPDKSVPGSVGGVTTLHRIQVAPQLLLFDSLIRISPVESPIETVSWRLPAGALIRDVTSEHNPIQRQTQSRDDDVTLLMELDRPATAATDLRVRFVLPVQSADGQLVLPLIHSPVVHASQATRQLAVINASSGMHVAISGGAGATSNDASQGFLREHVPNPDLSTVREFVGPMKLQLTVEQAQVRRESWCNQEFVVRTRRIDWAADIELNISDAAAFQHEFVVAPRVTIESVKVESDGASRIARWHRDGNRLLILLSGRSLGFQNVKITGNFAFRDGRDVELPAFRVEDAVSAESSVRIFSTDGRTLILDKASHIVPQELPSLHVGPPGTTLQHAFLLGTATSSMPSIRSVERPACRFDEAIRVQASPDGKISVVTLLHRTHHTSPTVVPQLQVSSELNARVRLVDSAGNSIPITGRSLPGNRIEFDFSGYEAATEHDTVRIDIDAQSTADRPFQIPAFRWSREIEIEKRYLVGREPWQPPNAALASAGSKSVTDWPPWLESIVESEKNWVISVTGDVSGQPWTTRRSNPDTDAALSVALSSTLIELASVHEVSGESLLFVNGATDDVLAIVWPAGIEHIATTINDVRISDVAVNHGQLRIPFPDDVTRPATVRIRWKPHVEPSRWAPWRFQCDVPSVAGTTVPPLITIGSPIDSALLRISGFRSTTHADFAHQQAKALASWDRNTAADHHDVESVNALAAQSHFHGDSVLYGTFDSDADGNTVSFLLFRWIWLYRILAVVVCGVAVLLIRRFPPDSQVAVRCWPVIQLLLWSILLWGLV